MVIVLSYAKEIPVVPDDLELYGFLHDHFNSLLARNVLKRYNMYGKLW